MDRCRNEYFNHMEIKIAEVRQNMLYFQIQVLFLLYQLSPLILKQRLNFKLFV
ncbi:unnamed protein product [Paramecium sonneborni]|uniref:Uncharacterized protein n=1 Tax=Paramecium sonneborni TaxID=65129 RepID=A0A8S1M7M5_9CILI|nr:unnamed protein product [Paramecium sonneborni]